MSVVTRRHPTEPFECVQWDGANLDEIAGFTGLTPSVTSGVLTLDLTSTGGSVVLLNLKWWVRRESDGELFVSSDDVARTWTAA